MPRPLKLTPALARRICDRLERGATLRAAAQAESVGKVTLWSWRQRGETGEEPFASFAHDVETALARAECSMLEKLAAIDEHCADPKLAGAMVRSLSWLLERTRRESYGPVVKLQVEEAKESLLDVAQRALEPFGGAFEALLTALERDGEEVATQEVAAPAVH